MELFEEVLVRYLLGQKIQITFPDLHIDLNEVVKMQAYQALQAIKAVLEDDSLDDAACFQKIERIVAIFEEIGSDGGNRHDFG